jgi:hypothetical protein
MLAAGKQPKMSDHVDGPRSIGDPAADLTDLFAFVSPRDPARAVLIANVFPSAGTTALFSNAIDYEIALRHVSVSGIGAAAKFTAGTDEVRFRFRFDALRAASAGKQRIQSGICTLPRGSALAIVVNDENGTPTPDGTFRIYAGLRSDPFNLAWNLLKMQRLPNLLQHDNVLSLVVEFDVRQVLDLTKGTLFGAIAETKPTPGPAGLISVAPQRIDTVGRPEQTNMRLNNPNLTGIQDLRDLWNQQDLFAIDPQLVPIFRQRMIESLTDWDMRDGKADWTSSALAASAAVFLDDHLLFDVSKPFSDASFFEIEKSTLNGRTYATGGGRTVNSNVIDILVNWTVNHDRGPALQGGSDKATKAGLPVFPYLASPNDALQMLEESVDVRASPDRVWSVVGDFRLAWHPLVADVAITGTGVGQIRTLETIDGKRIIERLDAMDDVRRRYRYTMISGVPAAHYAGTLSVQPKRSGSSVDWQVQYLADGQPDLVVRTVISTLLKVGLTSLQARFNAAP